ncbi:hypothetical protein GIB67_030544 [Kingdonia uniflora]|uniref:Transposase n=1 Tax=Kingdonia uniflora TaxID=39325 RepID=A0A7J7P2V3_9MAGN|nr:hypothetical protein GIB67_030544 [Kingdonia uniflora]
MIIMHEYPLHMVEHSAFISFVQNLQPRFSMVNFSTVQGDCVAIYLREKQNLVKLLGGISGHISITLDLWSSCQTLGYVFLTAHFIDNDWKLQRRVLNVVEVSSPDREDALSHAIGVCIGDWGLDGKVFTLTLDKGISNDNEIPSLRGYLWIKNPLLLNGQLLIEQCYPHVLSSIAQDGLTAIQEIINKIRDSVKYVKTSNTHEEKFAELRQQLQVPSTKTLALDDQTRWDTTYLMLVAALEMREVFCCMDTADPDYKIAISLDEWKQVETLCAYLKLFFDGTNILTSSAYPTANAYFHDVGKIQLELTHAAMGEDSFIRDLTHPMKEKFDKFWRDCSLALAIAVVMDPRFKMKLVEFSFSKVYGDDFDTYVKIVDEGIHELFSEYVMQPLLLTTYPELGDEGEVKTEPSQDSLIGGDGNGTLLSNGDGLMDFDVFISELSSSQPTKSELDQYLDESLLPRAQDFDILSWWKLNNLKYPILSRMARDILSIPVSTVGVDAVFNTARNKLDNYRSSLRHETVEALICAKDWLQNASKEPLTAIVKMEY